MKSVRWSLLGVSLVLVFAATPLRAQLFFEGFNNTGSNISLTTLGHNWKAYYGTTAVDVSGATSGNAVIVAGIAGNPNTSNGFLFTNTSGTYAAITTLSAPITVPNNATVSFTMGNGDTSSIARIMVLSGGNWYAHGEDNQAWFQSSGTTFASGANFAAADTASVTYDFSFTTSSGWRLVTLNPGSTLSLAGPETAGILPSPTIEGIGFYALSGGIMRFDSLTVIPEPSVAALLLPALAGLALVRRSPRKPSRA